jgi:hypothetical protein
MRFLFLLDEATIIDIGCSAMIFSRYNDDIKMSRAAISALKIFPDKCLAIIIRSNISVQIPPWK